VGENGLRLDPGCICVMFLSMIDKFDEQQGGGVEVQISADQYAVACDCISALIGKPTFYRGGKLVWRPGDDGQTDDYEGPIAQGSPEQAYGPLFSDLIQLLREKGATIEELGVLYHLSPIAKIELFTNIDLMQALMQADKFSPNLLKIFAILIRDNRSLQVEEVSFTSFLRDKDGDEEGGDEVGANEEPVRVAVTQMMMLSDITAGVDEVLVGDKEQVAQPYMGTQILHSSDIEEALVKQEGELFDVLGKERRQGAANAGLIVDLEDGGLELEDARAVDDGTFKTGMYGQSGEPDLDDLKRAVFAEVGDPVFEDDSTQAPDKPSDTSLPSTSRRSGLLRWFGRQLKRLPWSSEKK
jgi:hypothetical protein